MHRVEPLQQPSLTAPSPSPATPSGPHTEEHHQAPSRILPFSQFLKDHKADDEYLIKPLENYGEMLTIFGNSVATVQYAKGSNEPLATEMEDNGGPEGDDKEVDGKCGTTTVDDNEASSSATKPSKRAKISESDDEGLIGAFKSAGERIAIAIERAGTADNTLPPDLFNKVISILGFEKTYKSLYYAHLVEYPHIGRAFYALPFDHKLTWLGKFIGDKFPRC